MQWFRLTVENRRNVTKFQKALSFLAELREYHHTYIYKLVKSTTSLVMHIISVAKALKNVSHIRGTQRMISVKYLFGCKVRQGWIQSSSSDLHKSLKFLPNLISQLFIAVNEINYPPCFIVYYEINKTTERLFHRSHSKPSPSQAKWTSHRSRVA